MPILFGDGIASYPLLNTPDWIRSENGDFEIKVTKNYSYNYTSQNYAEKDVWTITAQGSLFFLAENKISKTFDYNIDYSYGYEIVDDMTGQVSNGYEVLFYNGNITYLKLTCAGKAQIERNDGSIITQDFSQYELPFIINGNTQDVGNGGTGPNATYTYSWCTNSLKFNGVTLIENCAVVAADTGCPCPDIQNMINAANKELYDAFVQWNGNRRTAKIELVKTLTEAMSKGNKDKFDKLSKEISDLKDKIWGG